MVLPQLVDAARVNGPSEELVHLVLRVQGLLSTAAGRGWKKTVSVTCTFVSECKAYEGLGLSRDRRNESQFENKYV